MKHHMCAMGYVVGEAARENLFSDETEKDVAHRRARSVGVGKSGFMLQS
jgi:hypothetical protein